MVAVKKLDSTTQTPVSVSDGVALLAPQKPLANALVTLARVADPKSTLPILAHVLLRVDAQGAVLAATDLNLTVSLRMDAWGLARGDFAVPAKQLATIVKSAGKADVTLTNAKSALRIASGGVETSLFGVHGRDFPKIPSSEGLAFVPVDGKEFADMIERVAFSASKDETRFFMCGVYMERADLGVRMVTTDGHRLTLAQAPGIGGSTIGDGVIVPIKAAREIARLIKSERGAAVSIASKGPNMFVRVGSWELATKLVDGKFPEFWQVIPDSHQKLVTVERKTLIDALKRAKPLTTDTRGVQLEADYEGYLNVSCDHPELGKMRESLVADVGCSTAIRTVSKVGISPRYLIELLESLDGEYVTIALGGELDPVVVRSTDDATQRALRSASCLGVVMPMRM